MQAAHLLVTCRGKAAHAGLAPEEGVSAILAMAGWLQQALALEERGARVSLEAVRGGLRPNVVAPECRAWLAVHGEEAWAVQRLSAALETLPARLAGAMVSVEIANEQDSPLPALVVAGEMASRAADPPKRLPIRWQAAQASSLPQPGEIGDYLAGQQEAMLALLADLARLETPSSQPEAQLPAFALLAGELASVGYEATWRPGRATGGTLLARPPRAARRGLPLQLLLGHCDTVWPVGALATMPVALRDGRLWGPGVFDMKAGLVQTVFALRALAALGLRPPAAPVVLVNSDEEIGSPESGRAIAALARIACRAFVMEPSLGPQGQLKTARKGVGQFRVQLAARPPQAQDLALELAGLVQTLSGLSDPAAGVTVNVGWVAGGTGQGVLVDAGMVIDVRVPDGDAARRIERAVAGLQPSRPGVTLEISGRVGRMPLERTERNQRLWQTAQRAGRALGLALEQCTVGGASDGNIASQYTATLDGLGAVGEGAHAAHEQALVSALPQRAALLALLLLEPPS